jgi:hypothetical protein
VGLERSGVGPAVDLLQDRRLDLDETLANNVSRIECRIWLRAADQLAGLGVDGQVDVAGPPRASGP